MGFVERLVTTAADLDGWRRGHLVPRHGYLDDEICNVENAWRAQDQNIDHLPPVNVRKRPVSHIHLTASDSRLNTFDCALVSSLQIGSNLATTGAVFIPHRFLSDDFIGLQRRLRTSDNGLKPIVIHRL